MSQGQNPELKPSYVLLKIDMILFSIIGSKGVGVGFTGCAVRWSLDVWWIWRIIKGVGDSKTSDLGGDSSKRTNFCGYTRGQIDAIKGTFVASMDRECR